jgi:glycerol-3-phosphate dehydrogenase (NAD(P)+)
MHQVMKQILPSSAGNRLAALSGPSFAREVALGQPTNLSIAAEETETAHSVQIQLSSRTFRLYTTEDVIGVEIGGAIKNVLAIAAGAVDGLGLGHNTKAALITRGIAEMTRLALAMGGHPRTLAGLSGIGDLVLTCTGHLSRNRKIGEAIGKGEDPRTVLKHMIAEGVETSKSVHALAIKHKVDMPICTEVYQSLHEGKPIQAALESLLSRELKDEVY